MWFYRKILEIAWIEYVSNEAVIEKMETDSSPQVEKNLFLTGQIEEKRKVSRNIL